MRKPVSEIIIEKIADELRTIDTGSGHPEVRVDFADDAGSPTTSAWQITIDPQMPQPQRANGQAPGGRDAYTMEVDFHMEYAGPRDSSLPSWAPLFRLQAAVLNVLENEGNSLRDWAFDVQAGAAAIGDAGGVLVAAQTFTLTFYTALNNPYQLN